MSLLIEVIFQLHDGNNLHDAVPRRSLSTIHKLTPKTRALWRKMLLVRGK